MSKKMSKAKLKKMNEEIADAIRYLDSVEAFHALAWHENAVFGLVSGLARAELDVADQDWETFSDACLEAFYEAFEGARDKVADEQMARVKERADR